MSACKVCDDEAWVCENHLDKPWNKTERGCECGAGAPCPACNPCDRDNPPRGGNAMPNIIAVRGKGLVN